MHCGDDLSMRDLRAGHVCAVLIIKYLERGGEREREILPHHLYPYTGMESDSDFECGSQRSGMSLRLASMTVHQESASK